ncbi:retroviral-like aspartic protease family protein [Novosphingobium huizhouense]|uniref:retroviral-like aspartic protease family protein n=1 Tax=Novosphingobium huizhouense TaxID=2866625 RepID=UPI001CD87580|nr:retroviral-like aspartic protease family protein [Novosphingobium huizhouense]
MRPRLPGAAGLLLVLATIAPARSQAQPPPEKMPADSPPAEILPPETISLGRDGSHRMTVPVRIGPAGPYDFLVDTGAERTVLARDIAIRLGLGASGTARMIGVAGEQDVDLVHVEEIGLGSRSFYGLSAPLLEGANIGADGIVGLDSLQGQRVLLDFDRNRMAIGDAGDLGGSRGFEIVVTARRKSGQLIMTDAVLDGVRTAVVIDTGSDASIGNRALQQALSRRHKLDQAQLFSVTGQSIMADIGLARRLELGRLVMTNTTIMFADAPPFDRLGLARKPALLLGMNQLRLFHRVAIDFAARRILFDMPEGTLLPGLGQAPRS